MTFEQALMDFEQGVQSKDPITGIPGSNRSTRRISDVSVVTTVRRRPIVPLGQRCSVNLLATKKLGGRDANTNQIR